MSKGQVVPLQAFAALIIDEAQNLTGILEEIRILSDLEQREKLLQVVLVGQPEFKSHLKMPQMRQVDQRVSVRCELQPLAVSDVGKYIGHRLSVASNNGSRVQFSDDAIDASATSPAFVSFPATATPTRTEEPAGIADQRSHRPESALAPTSVCRDRTDKY